MTSESNKKNLLSAPEICEIIKQSGLSGVSELSYGGLKITFDRPSESEAPTIEPLPAGETPEPSNHQPSQTREAIIEDQASAAQRELDDLLLSDPQEFERRVLSGDLVDEAAKPR